MKEKKSIGNTRKLMTYHLECHIAAHTPHHTHDIEWM